MKPASLFLKTFSFQKPNENVIYSVVGEEGIQVKTEVCPPLHIHQTSPTP